MPPRFIATGVGRSGTGYLAALLTSSGIPAGHEMFFHSPVHAPGTPDEYCRSTWSDVSWLAAPHLRRFAEFPVIHLIRNPIAVIRSIARTGLFTRPGAHAKWAALHVDYPADPLDAAIVHWIEWNRLIESAPNERHAIRLEDLHVAATIRSLLEFLGAPQLESAAVAALSTMKPVDSLAHVNPASEIPSPPEIVARGESFGLRLAAAARGYDLP